MKQTKSRKSCRRAWVICPPNAAWKKPASRARTFGRGWDRCGAYRPGMVRLKMVHSEETIGFLSGYQQVRARLVGFLQSGLCLPGRGAAWGRACFGWRTRSGHLACAPDGAGVQRAAIQLYEHAGYHQIQIARGITLAVRTAWSSKSRRTQPPGLIPAVFRPKAPQ